MSHGLKLVDPCNHRLGADQRVCCCVQVFGLHSNADISYYTSNTKELWSNLIDLQPRVGAAAGGISREEFVASVARDVAAKIPEQFDLPLLAKGLGVPTPTQVVLLQELARWNTVLEAMSSSLKDLQRALSGVMGMQVAYDHTHRVMTLTRPGVLQTASKLYQPCRQLSGNAAALTGCCTALLMLCRGDWLQFCP